MSEEHRQDPLAKVETERRDFLKKIAVAAAFAAPTIATFSVDGMRKKAFAQAAYDPPQVISFAESATDGRAVVRFSQPMDTGAGADLLKNGFLAGGDYRTIDFDTAGVVYGAQMHGDQEEWITYSGCQAYSYLTVTYNLSGPGKLKGKNGLECLPFSGTIGVDVPGYPCWT